jgi:hypothetical protein
MCDNYCRKLVPRQPVPEAYSPKLLVQTQTAAEEDAYRAVIITAKKFVQFEVCLSYCEVEATTWSITDMDYVVNQLEREIYVITSNDQILFMKEFSICVVEFEAGWQVIGIQERWKTIEQHVNHFGYPKMHLWSQISESFWRMGSRDNFTTDMFERLHIGNVKEAY